MAKPGKWEDLAAADARLLAGLGERLKWGSRKDGSRGCLEWQGKLGAGGYVVIFALGRVWYGHRLAWMLKNGEIPEGMYVCHHCDNRKCLEETHLFLGTVVENLGDMMTKGRNSWGPGRPAGEPDLDKQAEKERVREEKQKEKEERKRKLVEVVVPMREAGATLWEIADAVGLKAPAVWQICRELGIQKPQQWTEEQMKQALEMIEKGATYREIGEMLGFSTSSVYSRVGPRQRAEMKRAASVTTVQDSEPEKKSGVVPAEEVEELPWELEEEPEVPERVLDYGAFDDMRKRGGGKR